VAIFVKESIENQKHLATFEIQLLKISRYVTQTSAILVLLLSKFYCKIIIIIIIIIIIHIKHFYLFPWKVKIAAIISYSSINSDKMSSCLTLQVYF